MGSATLIVIQNVLSLLNLIKAPVLEILKALMPFN
jgi:hypothetical protein